MTDLQSIYRASQQTKWHLYLFPTSALVVVVGAAEALVSPRLRVPQVTAAVPGPGVQAGIDLHEKG